MKRHAFFVLFLLSVVMLTVFGCKAKQLVKEEYVSGVVGMKYFKKPYYYIAANFSDGGRTVLVVKSYKLPDIADIEEYESSTNDLVKQEIVRAFLAAPGDKIKAIKKTYTNGTIYYLKP